MSNKQFYHQISSYNIQQDKQILNPIGKQMIEEQLLSITRKQIIQKKEQDQVSPIQKMLGKVDGEGKYQKRSFIIFSSLWLLTAWISLGIGFFFDNSFTCADERYSDKSQCTTHICGLTPEKRKDQISSHPQSIIFQFNQYLICQDNDNLVSVIQSMLFVGALFGFFVIPYMADNYGRKLAMRVSWGLATVSILILFVSDSPNMVGLSFFLIGFSTNPAITLTFTFINQICLGRTRSVYGVGMQIAWAIGQITIALIFLIDISWKYITFLILILYGVVLVTIIKYVQETPIYMSKKDESLALEILNNIAKVNNKQPLKVQQLDQQLHKIATTLNIQSQLHQQQKSLDFSSLFKYKSIRWTSISTAIIMFGIQIMYYSSQLNTSDVGFTKVTNQIVFGFSEMFGYIAAQFIIGKMARKKITIVGLSVSVIMCVLMGILEIIKNEDNEETMKWVETCVLMIDRFILCSFWCCFYVYMSELYPTEVSSLGFGWTSVIGQIGSTLSPFVITLSSKMNINSWFLPAIFGLIGLVFAFCLQETLNQSFKQTVKQRIETLLKQKSEIDNYYSDDSDNDTKSQGDAQTQIQKDYSVIKKSVSSIR